MSANEPQCTFAADVSRLCEAGVRVLTRRTSRTTKGDCQEICLATALSATGLEGPICLSWGKVSDAGGDETDHFWLRTDGTIIDPCADQFAMPYGEVHVQSEGDQHPLNYHCDESRFLFIRVGKILRLSRLRTDKTDSCQHTENIPGTLYSTHKQTGLKGKMK